MQSSGKVRLSAPPLSNAEVIREAERLIERYVQIVGEEHLMVHGLRFQDVYGAVIEPQYNIVLVENVELGVDEHRREILGTYDPQGNVARISAQLPPGTRDPRRTFTLYHEVGGHGVLQGQHLRDQCLGHVVVTADSLSTKTRDRLERQANLFAANAAAPDWFVRRLVHIRFGRDRFLFTTPGRQSFGLGSVRRPTFIRDAGQLSRLVAGEIADSFGGLSVQALSYRLLELGLVVDRSRGSLLLQRTAPNHSIHAPTTSRRALLDRAGAKDSFYGRLAV